MSWQVTNGQSEENEETAMIFFGLINNVSTFCQDSQILESPLLKRKIYFY